MSVIQIINNSKWHWAAATFKLYKSKLAVWLNPPEWFTPQCSLKKNNLVVHVSSKRGLSVSQFLNNDISYNNYRPFPVNTVRHEIGKKKKKRNSRGNCHIPPVNIITIVFTFILLADGRWQSTTVQSCVFCELEVRHWFTNFLPTTRTGKKKISIELLTHT